MRKVGILGGTFNPPHHGHLLIANEVLSSLQLDEIWFMPNQEPPHKEKLESIKNEDRQQMLELAVGDNKKFRVEPIELGRKGPSFTVETMRILKTKYREYQFFFIIGADMVEYLPKWYKIDELIKMVQFVGVDRPTYSHKTNYPILYVDIPSFEISSSLIRERLKSGKTVRYLMPELVIDFIKENHIYGT